MKSRFVPTLVLATNFEVELEAKRSLRRGGPDTLNIYTIEWTLPGLRIFPLGSDFVDLCGARWAS